MKFPVTAPQTMQYFKTTRSYDKVLEKVNILSIKDGHCTAEVKLSEEHMNVMGGLHGGFSATLVDYISSLGLFTHKNAAVPSVSVDIHLTYLRGAKLGEEITIDARTIKTGKSLAFLEVLLKDKSTGDLLVKGNHTKFLLRDNGTVKPTTEQLDRGVTDTPTNPAPRRPTLVDGGPKSNPYSNEDEYYHFPFVIDRGSLKTFTGGPLNFCYATALGHHTRISDVRFSNDVRVIKTDLIICR